MPPALVVFTRDLRVRDHPALSAACAGAEAVVPLFVHDDTMPIVRSANRNRFLRDAVADLDASLRARGAHLVERHGPWTDTVTHTAAALGVTDIHLTTDVSAYAQKRDARLRDSVGRGVSVHTHDGVTIVPPGAVTPTGGEFFKVFTPYHRRWLDTEWRRPLPPPEHVPMADISALGLLGRHRTACESGAPAPELLAGGESEGLSRLRSWARRDLSRYADAHNDLAADATSHISAYLHLGCLSPGEVAWRLHDRPGGAAFVRQLCWRDFYHQILSARPDTAAADFRPRTHSWNDDPEAFDAWQTGRTGYPLIDAAMNQLRTEGFMHNRARMVVASFLTKDLNVDWRLGAAHFMTHLVDGDVANNQLNWQWVAGTGTDTNPNRIFNPVTQGQRFDPAGNYIRRYLPELSDLESPAVHWPDEAQRKRLHYPAPIVDHRDAIAAYRASTTSGGLR